MIEGCKSVTFRKNSNITTNSHDKLDDQRYVKNFGDEN